MIRWAWLLSALLLLAAPAAPAADEEAAATADAAEDEALRQGVSELWRESITAPPDDADREKRTDLLATVRRLRALHLEAGETQASSDAARAASDAAAAAPTTRPVEAVAAPPPQRSGLDVATLETLRTKVAPDSVADPLALADMLFKAGHDKTAGAFYRIALRRAPPAQEEAWILLQLGNCLRDDDPAAAREAYRRVIAEHADSPWTPLAEAYDGLLAWKNSARPTKLIRKIEQLPSADAPLAVDEDDE
ncbi:MAG: hypothetical protein KGY99_04875 [Phycisphaerae bacterium]|nr:hypothetical protein [Phycisphaerae bacterium]